MWSYGALSRQTSPSSARRLSSIFLNSRTHAGNTLIGNTIFFINQNFTEVQYSMEAEEYEQVQNAISQFKEQIEEAEE